MNELKSSGISFDISKWEVQQAWETVRANKGAPGVDEVTLEEFEKDLKNNLYKIWNRMSSGSYVPPPVRAVEIPKPGGGHRVLGVPTVGDRIAQTVVASRLESEVEPIFHPDSYGYRPGRSATDAVETCKQRCWKSNWVIDLDIRAFFDTVDWDLVVKAVEANTDDRWVVLYVRRWLAAPLALPDGTVETRDRGTPRGSAISPVLANLFLHYAFDAWMARQFPGVQFERYVDDAVVHCVSKAQAEFLARAIAERMGQVGLELHPEKTKIIYCKDGSIFTSFLPAVSKKALKQMSAMVRSWRLHRRTGHSLVELAAVLNPIIRGWMTYYGTFYRSGLYGLLSRINAYILRWIRRKYDRLRPFAKAKAAWKRIITRVPALFAHWRWCTTAW